MLQLTLDFLGQVSGLTGLKRDSPTRRSRVDHSLVWKQGLTVHVVFRLRARRYLLGLNPDGSVRLVIPRRGSEEEGVRFLERSEPWLAKRLAHWRSRSDTGKPWGDGTRFFFRGEEVALRVEAQGNNIRLTFADQLTQVAHPLSDYRKTVLAHLRSIAEQELPRRARELAAVHGITVNRVTVRAQKTRWGSCSARGAISLNWRLIQAPAFVVDYLIVHELMHRREMNHSARYWKLVEKSFPDYRLAEKWLKKSGIELRVD
jgi:predicted metal-dependent hydrolase